MKEGVLEGLDDGGWVVLTDGGNGIKELVECWGDWNMGVGGDYEDGMDIYVVGVG